MTQNKTELQEALDFLHEVWDGNQIHLQKLDVVMKAAQAYTELPEKVMELQTYLLHDSCTDKLISRFELLTILENQDD